MINFDDFELLKPYNFVFSFSSCDVSLFSVAGFDIRAGKYP